MKIKHYYNALIHSHATPEEVAGGFALGVFVSMTPTLGLHMILAAGFAALFKKNAIAAALGTWVTNPLTLFPVYYFTHRVGQTMMGESRLKILRPDSIRDLFHMGKEIFIPLLLGGILVGLLAAFVSYFFVKRLYPILKKKKKELIAKIHE
ncbi:MAG: DUF2062 domain-containing protein [Deltaproteobacteria bacterium]|nr:DUF2062 domain-containing protein [Deltaproteobacteria bacterium]